MPYQGDRLISWRVYPTILFWGWDLDHQSSILLWGGVWSLDSSGNFSANIESPIIKKLPNLSNPSFGMVIPQQV